MSKWIHFEEVPDTKRKTKLFNVRAKESNIILGQIKWWGAWRCYSFFPVANTLFESQCLNDIVSFLGRLMLDRKVEKQNAQQ